MERSGSERMPDATAARPGRPGPGLEAVQKALHGRKRSGVWCRYSARDRITSSIPQDAQIRRVVVVPEYDRRVAR